MQLGWYLSPGEKWRRGKFSPGISANENSRYMLISRDYMHLVLGISKFLSWIFSVKILYLIRLNTACGLLLVSTVQLSLG